MRNILKWIFKEEWDEFRRDMLENERRFQYEWMRDVKNLNMIIGVLLRNNGGQVRIHEYELLDMEGRTVVAEISRTDNSTLYTLKI